MSDVLAFARLGFSHIVSLDALDHLLFLLALAVVYRPSDWRSLMWAVSAFTIGHSITLALAVMNVLNLPAELIETLIPATIVATALGNLASLRWGGRATHRVLLVGAFGLIHGAGFANYLRSLFIESVAVPLIGFNIGVEVGQLFVVGVVWMAAAGLDRLAAEDRRPVAYQTRVALVSASVTIVASGWVAQRLA